MDDNTYCMICILYSEPNVFHWFKKYGKMYSFVHICPVFLVTVLFFSRDNVQITKNRFWRVGITKDTLTRTLPTKRGCSYSNKWENHSGTCICSFWTSFNLIYIDCKAWYNTDSYELVRGFVDVIIDLFTIL